MNAMREGLGDRWGADPAPAETSMVSVEYWRDKAREFQATINAVDTVAQESWNLASILPDGIERNAILQGLDEFEARRGAMKLAAEGINAGAAVINAAGGRFPVLSIPQSLGLGPLVLPAAAIAAFTTAAGLIAWALAWNRAQIARMDQARGSALQIADPAARDETLAEIARIQARAEAAAQSGESPLASIAGIAKWVGLGALAFIAWRFLDGSNLLTRD